jgi:hypothetical protein
MSEYYLDNYVCGLFILKSCSKCSTKSLNFFLLSCKVLRMQDRYSKTISHCCSLCHYNTIFGVPADIVRPALSTLKAGLPGPSIQNKHIVSICQSDATISCLTISTKSMLTNVAVIISMLTMRLKRVPKKLFTEKLIL